MERSVLLEALRKLEVSLHDPRVRASADQFGAHLHPAFREFGRSGGSYTREEIIASVAGELAPYEIWSQDFELEVISEGLALLTYRSAHVAEQGELEHHTNRAPLWQQTESGWKIRFHQGTPTCVFERSAT